ncbi:hypothetical protein BH10BAC3_BH10BAC3_00650 [soil metagenome]
MNHNFGCLFLLLVTATGCKKTLEKLTTGPDNLITIEVVEASTAKPLNGAELSLDYCTKYDFYAGCTDFSTRIVQTNTDGKATFPSNKLERITKIHRANYWSIYPDFSLPDPLTFPLFPICTIKAIIKQINTYAPGDDLNINVSEPSCTNNRCEISSKSVGLPVDSVVYFKAFGYADNLVYWQVNNSSFTSLAPVYITGFDTATVTINY